VVLLATSTIGDGTYLGEGGAADAMQLLAMHLLAAATDEEATQLLATGGLAPGLALPPDEDLAPVLPLDEEPTSVLAHPCARMAAAIVLRWYLMHVLVWWEKREGGGSGEIGMRTVTTFTQQQGMSSFASFLRISLSGI
jgi:hypothetical protein